MTPATPPIALPLQQHPRFARAVAQLGARTSVVDNDGGRAAVLSRRFGPFGQVQMVSRGPVWTADAAMRQQTYVALRDAGVRIINAETPDNTALRGAGYGLILTAPHVAQINLLRPDYRSAMQAKWRNRLRRAEAAHLQCHQRPFDMVTDGWLLSTDQRQQREKSYRNYPVALTRALAAQGPDAMTLFWVDGDQAPMAAMVFVNHLPVVTYHIGWTSSEGRQRHAHNLLMSQAIMSYTAAGYHRIDLGQVDTHAAPGLARFKIGTGADVRALGGTWLQLGRGFEALRATVGYASR